MIKRWLLKAIDGEQSPGDHQELTCDEDGVFDCEFAGSYEILQYFENDVPHISPDDAVTIVRDGDEGAVVILHAQRERHFIIVQEKGTALHNAVVQWKASQHDIEVSALTNNEGHALLNLPLHEPGTVTISAEGYDTYQAPFPRDSAEAIRTVSLEKKITGTKQTYHVELDPRGGITVPQRVDAIMDPGGMVQFHEGKARIVFDINEKPEVIFVFLPPYADTTVDLDPSTVSFVPFALAPTKEGPQTLHFQDSVFKRKVAGSIKINDGPTLRVHLTRGVQVTPPSGRITISASAEGYDSVVREYDYFPLVIQLMPVIIPSNLIANAVRTWSNTVREGSNVTNAHISSLEKAVVATIKKFYDTKGFEVRKEDALLILPHSMGPDVTLLSLWLDIRQVQFVLTTVVIERWHREYQMRPFNQVTWAQFLHDYNLGWAPDDWESHYGIDKIAHSPAIREHWRKAGMNENMLSQMLSKIFEKKEIGAVKREFMAFYVQGKNAPMARIPETNEESVPVIEQISDSAELLSAFQNNEWIPDLKMQVLTRTTSRFLKRIDSQSEHYAREARKTLHVLEEKLKNSIITTEPSEKVTNDLKEVIEVFMVEQATAMKLLQMYRIETKYTIEMRSEKSPAAINTVNILDRLIELNAENLNFGQNMMLAFVKATKNMGVPMSIIRGSLMSKWDEYIDRLELGGSLSGLSLPKKYKGKSLPELERSPAKELYSLDSQLPQGEVKDKLKQLKDDATLTFRKRSQYNIY